MWVSRGCSDTDNNHRSSRNRSMGLPHTPAAWTPCGEDGLLTEETCAFRAYASKGATSASPNSTGLSATRHGAPTSFWEEL